MKARKIKSRAYVIAADHLKEAERNALPVGWRYSPYDRPVANYFLVCHTAQEEIILYPIRLDYYQVDDGSQRAAVYIGAAPGRDGLPLPYTCARALVKWCRQVPKKSHHTVLVWGMVHTPRQYDFVHALTGGIYPNYNIPAPRNMMPTLIELGRRHFGERFQALNATVEPVYPRAYPQPRPTDQHFFSQRNPQYRRGDGLLVAFRMGIMGAIRLLIRSAWAQYRPQRFIKKAMEHGTEVWKERMATKELRV